MHKCVDDNLILKEIRQGCRGKATGKMIDVYCVPREVVSLQYT